MKELRVRVTSRLLAAIDSLAAKHGITRAGYAHCRIATVTATEELHLAIVRGTKRCACGGRLRLEGTKPLDFTPDDIPVAELLACAWTRTRCAACGEWTIWSETGDEIDSDAHIATEKGWDEIKSGGRSVTGWWKPAKGSYLRVRVTDRLDAAIRKASELRQITMSAWVTQALVGAVRADGIDV